MSDPETILYEVGADGIARLTLNRPERLDGMTNRMVVETHRALERAARDERIRVLVLTGAGKGFCPGADLGHFTSGASADDERLAPEDLGVPLLLHEMPAVTIAAVNGACAGAGLGWACGCDLRLAARSANFSTAFLRVAVAGDMALPWSLPRLVGASKARELSFLCEKFGAEEAARIGLVARVFDDTAFRAEVDAIAARLARSSPLAHLEITKSEDTAEAFRAFVEKREPRFRTA